jgi:cell fate regulator YaaT (PSP1 superfamily)
VSRYVSVVFNEGGKIYHFDPGALELQHGDNVIVTTSRGTDFGRVVGEITEVAAEEREKGLKKVVRVATDADLAQVASNCDRDALAIETCRELIAQRRLEIKPIAADSTFDGNRVTISFSAKERTDVRELASRLSDRLQRRVEMRQVSDRDEARLVGGYGQCGRRLCCTSFAGDQEPVSIRMAKDQNLPLNPSKISGCCGRLMCCLKYEHKVYVGFKKRAPKKGSMVKTPAGEGRVVDLQVPGDSVTVDLGEGHSVRFRLDELGSDKEET